MSNVTHLDEYHHYCGVCKEVGNSPLHTGWSSDLMSVNIDELETTIDHEGSTYVLVSEVQAADQYTIRRCRVGHVRHIDDEQIIDLRQVWVCNGCQSKYADKVEAEACHPEADNGNKASDEALDELKDRLTNMSVQEQIDNDPLSRSS